MEGVVTTISGLKRPAASPRDTPTKKTNFVGISPLKELTNVKTPTDRPFRVSIEGNIGAGKSTLIKYFAGMEGIETYAVYKCMAQTTQYFKVFISGTYRVVAKCGRSQFVRFDVFGHSPMAQSVSELCSVYQAKSADNTAERQ